MRSFIALLIGTTAACAIAACSSSTDNGTGTPGTGTDSGTVSHPDGSVASDSGGGGESDAGAGGDTNTCSLPQNLQFGKPSCTTCANDKCCDSVLRCFNDAPCVTLNNCLVDCVNGVGPNDAGFDASDDGGLNNCESQCLSAPGVTQAVTQELQAQLACMNTNCKTACQ